MSLWADYIRELRGPDSRVFLEYPYCFASYSLPELSPDVMIIHDMFVAPAFRKNGRGKVLLSELEEIGRKAGRKYVLSELEIQTKTFDVAFKAQVAAGFLPVAAANDIIVMRKTIEGGNFG